MLWLPLDVHLKDCAAIAKKLWRFRLSDALRRLIANDCNCSIDSAERLLIFLAAVHDIGKATPLFQSKQATFPPCDSDAAMAEIIKNAGFVLWENSRFANAGRTPHALMGEKLLIKLGCNGNAAAIIGAHHGKPIDFDPYNTISAYSAHYSLNSVWDKAQAQTVEMALSLSGFTRIEEVPSPNQPAQMLLSALLIMADWISSNEKAFPYFQFGITPSEEELALRAESGWRAFSLQSPTPPDDAWRYQQLYEERFGYTPNMMQNVVRECVGANIAPSLVVIEAPMGMGKTEAALVAAEIIENRTGRSGMFFALPTQATANAVFSRILSWTQGLMPYDRYTVKLAHGKAQFNDDYTDLPMEGVGINDDGAEDGAVTNTWFEGGKKSLLADYVVGTIDQLLLMALKQKHVMLRHLGLADKMVVIDECHAYDAYMNCYLTRALSWLGAYGVPVVIMSATLPRGKRDSLIAAYMGKKVKAIADSTSQINGYPKITCVEDGIVCEHPVPFDGQNKSVEALRLDSAQLIPFLQIRLSSGGCAGVIVNTVAKSQQIYCELCESFGREAVRLIHARFLTEDRTKTEKELIRELGKASSTRPRLRIVVGTQVLEQSLDIDFDLMVTALCPMDMLLQRIGRLHRHERTRPSLVSSPVCAVISQDDGGSESVYGRCLLMRTRAILPYQISIPEDIPKLVDLTYDFSYMPDNLPDGYEDAYNRQLMEDARRSRAAETFELCKPSNKPNGSITGILNSDVPCSEQRADAAVRDGDESIEVIMLQSVEGRIGFLPWHEQIPLDPDLPLTSAQAKAVAGQCVRLPRPLCLPWNIERTISQLEERLCQVPTRWQKSPWLSGQLFLILDGELSATLNGYCIHYDRYVGLECKKEENE